MSEELKTRPIPKPVPDSWWECVFNFGWDAGRIGYTEADSPFSAETDEHAVWEDGRRRYGEFLRKHADLNLRAIGRMSP